VQNALRRLSPEIDANIQTALSCGTDLGAIRNYLEKRGIFKYLEGIEEDGLRCAKIVSDMLNFSRRSDSQTMIRSDISQLIDDTINLAFSDYDLKKKYDFTRIRIKREYSAALKRVPCIPSEIQQVIFNLLKNAAQAMNGMNRQPVIEVKTSGSGQEAVIEVSDNGPGMDEKTRRRVFEPFFTTKNIGYGTGLGLSVSYFIIASNHRGKISVESESEKGTKFIIRLPLNSPNCS
jgi:signal transduction histidine kinase